MTELYPNISEELRSAANTAWNMALTMPAKDAAEFLDNVTKYYEHTLDEEDKDFLQFYFNMRMEMMNK